MEEALIEVTSKDKVRYANAVALNLIEQLGKENVHVTVFGEGNAVSDYLTPDPSDYGNIRTMNMFVDEGGEFVACSTPASFKPPKGKPEYIKTMDECGCSAEIGKRKERGDMYLKF